MLKGTNLSGTSTTRNRVEDDYYATPTCSTEALLSVEKFNQNIWECACGGGHLSDVLENHGYKTLKTDIVQRRKDVQVLNFLDNNITKYNGDIITNPPYSLAQEFLEKAINIVEDGAKVALFLKIQFLEGKKRKEMFEKYPPKVVYVFSERQNPLRNGEALDEKGKSWSSTMCFAWFVWEKGYKGYPIIKWL